MKSLLANANLPGRIVWTGSSTCSKSSFSWNDPQHIHGHLSFYSHKYFTHLLQPAINEHLQNTGVQSFEGCPGMSFSSVLRIGLILTGTSPKFFKRLSWLMYILGYFWRFQLMYSFFCPTIQVWPASGARTLLHIGTHRKEYKDLDPNHLYYMRWRLQGLVKSPFVDDVSIGESRKAFEWLYDLYKQMHDISININDVSESMEEIRNVNNISRSRSYSL